MRLSGIYNDGKTSQRITVDLIPTVQGLQIYLTDGTTLAHWPYDGLRLAEEIVGGRGVRFRHRDMGEALLSSESSEILTQIESASGVRLRRNPILTPSTRVAYISGAVVVVIGLLLWFGLPLMVAPIAKMIPSRWERDLGEGVINNLRRGQPFCASPVGLAALEAMAGPLIIAANASFPIKVRVIPGKMVNAFATMGGQVVIFQGLIDKAETPEEVAGVLAHEIAHAMERHPLQTMLRTIGISALIGMVVGDTSSLGSIATQTAEIMLVLSYSRDTEREADRIGMRLLNQAGMRGDGLIRFFQRLQGDAKTPLKNSAKFSDRLPVLFSSHPMHEERIARLKKLATGTHDALRPEQWRALRGICANVPKNKISPPANPSHISKIPLFPPPAS